MPLHFETARQPAASPQRFTIFLDDQDNAGVGTDDGATKSTQISQRTIVPVCVGHLAHAHDAALRWKQQQQHPSSSGATQHDDDDDDSAQQLYSRLEAHETERLASWRNPKGAKAAELIPALSGEWYCASLFSPRPRDPVRGGESSSQSAAPGEITSDWENRGAIFWHEETVGSTFSDAAKLLWIMENVGAQPICNQATNETDAQGIRFLGRYTINDYGMGGKINNDLDSKSDDKLVMEKGDDETTHFDILLGEEGQHPSLGSACFFVTAQDYWKHVWPDLCERRFLMELEEPDAEDEYANGPDIDEVAIPNGLHTMQTVEGELIQPICGALAVARKADYMFLRVFLNSKDEESTKTPGVRALLFYHSVGPDECSFAAWRVGTNATNANSYASVLPGHGLPPGGTINRNDQVDDLYGCRPFDAAPIESFFQTMDDDELVHWWESLPLPLAKKFVLRVIRAGFVTLWTRLERASQRVTGRPVLGDCIDRSSLLVALDVPEFKPAVAPQCRFQNAPPVPVAARRAMVENIIAMAERKQIMKSWIEVDFEPEVARDETDHWEESPPRIIGCVDDVEMNRRILSAHPSPSQVLAQARGYDGFDADERGIRPLMAAAECGETELVQLYLSLGAPPADCCQSGWSAIAFAAAAGSKECVRAIVNVGGGATNEQNPSILNQRVPIRFGTEIRGTLVDVALSVYVLGLAFIDVVPLPNDSTRAASVTSGFAHYAFTRGDIAGLKRLQQSHTIMSQRRHTVRADGGDDEDLSERQDRERQEREEKAQKWTLRYEECAAELSRLNVKPSSDDAVLDVLLDIDTALEKEEIRRRLLQLLQKL